MSTEGCLIMVEDSNSCSSSAPGSTPSSPRNRVKFLCSHGGKILPRPVDGQLKYVGGETRVISVPRDIKFSELMKKLTYLIDEEMVLKYQLIPEDLDALVSVKNDEDLRHMFNEHDLYESAGTPRLRSFLFPAKAVVVENHVETHAVEQRYIDAINGIIRSSTVTLKNHPTLNIFHNPSSFGISSACSSPRSPESYNTDATPHEAMFHCNFHNSRTHMQRVQSSPSVCNLTGLHQSSLCGHQMYPPNYYQTAMHPPHQGYYSSKPPIDPHKCAGPERLISVRSVGRAEGARYQMDYVPSQYQSGGLRHSRGSGCCSKCMHSDDYGPSSDRRADRGSSLSPSPVTLSPRYGHTHMLGKPWDSAVGGDC
ncbi:OLC1v1038887C1 [Oldenlandia corymbosa var. corymbosa]|uniref:OLC1v1038887C1 n=1 Tax=Oldenlandia corymbosa var. corymbosa TaxID=529605 RepID=A0AAV1D203_OLDCO|nr:OLC1v1038887C1 [Oldenlandia corymbosa var. corymbosa]